MASLTCPNCGKDNPDFLDDCQFCQAPLRREATLNIGEGPTKKSTGELEGVLPDWLKEARQQARDSAEEEAGVPPSMPRVQKDEPQDLLAGLAFQAADDEEEVPDWLSAIGPIKDEKQASAEGEAPSDFFAQFNQPAEPEPTPEEPQSEPSAEPKPFAFDPDATAEDDTAWLGEFNAPTSQPEDLGWLRDLEASSKAPEPSAPQADTDWMSNLEATSGGQEDLSWLNSLGGTPAPAEPAPAQPAEDLGWLNNLSGLPLDSEPTPPQPAAPKEDLNWLENLGMTAPAEPAAPQEDLSWLNNLGGTPAPAEPTPTGPAEDLGWLDTLGGASATEEPPTQKPEAPQEDLGWLKDFGATPAPSLEEPAAPQPEASQEDLSWLNTLGATPAEAASSEPASAQEDLGWLNEMAGATAPAEPAASQEGLDWLDNLGDTPAAESSEPAPEPFRADVPDWLKTVESALPEQQLSPAHTAPLSPEAASNIPDWLKEATQSAAPSLPPLEATPAQQESSFDELFQGLDTGAPEEAPAFDQTQPEPFDQTQDKPAPATHELFPALANPSPAPEQDVDALFDVDLPDWLTQQPETLGEPSGSGGIPAGLDASLSPADLPSWVQAMRPVESVVSETSAASADQNTERQGPLAGFRGVIPAFPIGSAQRPKAVSLKLQATDEQQAGAALIEQIIKGEAQPQAVKAATFVASQRALRWGLSALFLIVLSIMLGLGTRSMPVDVSASQMAEIQNLSSTILALPEGAPVLVVMDYEPALAGELESAAGPLLDQLTLLRSPALTFVATSSNGTALVERLLRNTNINRPVENGGLGYQAGGQYFNLGYLPGGSAGVRGFVENPQSVMPTAGVSLFSDFAAVILLTDHAESGLVWIEQVELAKQTDPGLLNQPLLVAASAQAGPLLQPYVSSRQVTGMISGLSDAARYEFANNTRPGIARSYWDAFGAGLGIAVIAIVLGSLWSLFAGRRAQRAEAEGG